MENVEVVMKCPVCQEEFDDRVVPSAGEKRTLGGVEKVCYDVSVDAAHQATVQLFVHERDHRLAGAEPACQESAPPWEGNNE